MEIVNRSSTYVPDCTYIGIIIKSIAMEIRSTGFRAGGNLFTRKNGDAYGYAARFQIRVK